MPSPGRTGPPGGDAAARGCGVEEPIAARARDLLSDLDLPADARPILRHSREGHAYPQICIAHMLGAARRAGATFLTGAAVIGLRAVTGGAEVALADGRVLAVAPGRGTGADAGMRGTGRCRGRLSGHHQSAARPALLPVDRGAAERAPGAGAVLQALDLDAAADPRGAPGPESGLAQTLPARLRAVPRRTRDARIDQIAAGQRTMPQDGRTPRRAGAAGAPALCCCHLLA